MAMRKPTKKELTSVPIEHLDLEKTTSVADLVDAKTMDAGRMELEAAAKAV